jgi:hypothetical protein
MKKENSPPYIILPCLICSIPAHQVEILRIACLFAQKGPLPMICVDFLMIRSTGTRVNISFFVLALMRSSITWIAFNQVLGDWDIVVKGGLRFGDHS